MAPGTPKTPLERVARLEIENAALRARIARIRTHDALGDTVASRRPAARPPALSTGLVFVTIGILSGLSIAILSARVSPRVPVEPAPVVQPLPTVPPVHAVPLPHVLTDRENAGRSH